MEKTDRSYIRLVRYAVQWGIVIFLLYAGHRFYRFVDHFLSGAAYTGRPPSVEGFLPIGALMSLKLWVTTGIFDRIHPAGLVIFIAALATAILLKKGFCGWICPVGALSDVTGKLGKKIFGRNPRLPGFVDYPLRSLKYALFLFFFYVIVVNMDPPSILSFLEGDYYKVADVKMLFFFTDMTMVTVVTLLVLFLLSLPLRNFWCRYLCPYGALLGLLSMASPLKITRDEEACIHCGRCSETCPSLLPVERKVRVSSPECMGCMSCVSRCPSKGALDIALPGKRRIQPAFFAVLMLILFFGIIAAGKVTGKWESAVTYEEYREIIPRSSLLDHP